MTGKLSVSEAEETMSELPASLHSMARRWRSYKQRRQPAIQRRRAERSELNYQKVMRAGNAVAESAAAAAAFAGSRVIRMEDSDLLQDGDLLREFLDNQELRDKLVGGQRWEEDDCKPKASETSPGKEYTKTSTKESIRNFHKRQSASFDYNNNHHQRRVIERLNSRERMLNSRRDHQKPLEALTQTTIDAIEQTLPWLSQQTRTQLSQAAGRDMGKADLEGASDSFECITGGQTRGSVAKRTIATYLKHNFYGKNLRWQTDVVPAGSNEESEGSSGDNYDLRYEYPEQNIGSRRRRRVGNKVERANYEEHLLACAVAAVTPNLISLVENEERNKRAEKCSQRDGGFIFGGTGKKEQAGSCPPNYSREKTVGDILGKVSLKSLTDPFDKSTQMHSILSKDNERQESHQHLHLSVDSIRLLLEHNLIATLIGAYILLSLAVITVLILPYLFNLPLTQMSSNSVSSEIVSSSYSLHTTQKLHENQLSSQSSSSRDSTTSSNLLQVRVVTSGSSQLNSERNSRSSDTETLLDGRQDSSRSSTGESINLFATTELPMSSSPSITDKTNDSELPSPATNGSSSRFFNLWSVVHNQPCQPMRVPFCGRFFEGMLSDVKGSPFGAQVNSGQQPSRQAETLAGYDKTLLPNQFTLARQSQIERLMQKYEPIVDIKCYPLMPLFLCSIYAPKCIKTSQPAPYSPVLINRHHHKNYEQSVITTLNRSATPVFAKSSTLTGIPAISKSWSRLVPPCKSLCKGKCTNFRLPQVGQLIDPEECEFLPESDDPNVCIGQQEHNLLKKVAETQNCQEDRFRCTNGECIPKKWRCDGYGDCIDKSDELKCSKCNAVTQFYCGLDKCINKEQVCNGIRDCNDGRDERQCLRLNPIVGLHKQSGKTIPGRLEVWSALKDSWRPVCGSDWSPMPMSHEVCQALGYSRASETLILYGVHPSNNQKVNHSSSLVNITNGPDEVKSVVRTRSILHNSASSNMSMMPTPTTTTESDVKEAATYIVDNPSTTVDTFQSQVKTQQSERSFGTGSPSSWFDVASADSAVILPDTTDTSEQLVDIIEDVVESSAKLNRVEWADHMVTYKRELASSDQLVSANIPLRAKSEMKLKSIIAMLYRGPEVDCNTKGNSLVSTVHIRCQNFQCGRSILSYQSRMKQQLQLQSLSNSKLKRKELKLVPRSALLQGERQEKEDNDGDVSFVELQETFDTPIHLSSNTSGVRRENRTHEADEELDYNLIDTFDEYYDDSTNDIELDKNSTLSIGKTNKQPYDTMATKSDEEDNDNDKQSKVDQELSEQSKSSLEFGQQQAISSRLVVGGIESMPGEFPYLAALHGGPDEVFFCGGVLISLNWLLTAAHCVGNRTQPNGWMVKVGVTRRIASPAFVKKLAVKKIIKHPAFNHGHQFNNDIALILLEESVEFNHYLRPICLPRANLKLGPNNSKDCVVVGFGKSKFSQEANYLHVAHFVNVPIVHHSVCSNWYAEQGVNITEGMLCAGYAEGKRDACQGDSGSGLFCRYSNTNQFFVAGVVSFGIKCATPKLPGVYTSVPLYVEWIKATTRHYGYLID